MNDPGKFANKGSGRVDMMPAWKKNLPGSATSPSMPDKKPGADKPVPEGDPNPGRKTCPDSMNPY